MDSTSWCRVNPRSRAPGGACGAHNGPAEQAGTGAAPALMVAVPTNAHG